MCHKYKINILLNVFTNMQFFSWNLCELEEGINSLLILPLQISNMYLIELHQHGMQFHYVCKSNL